MTTRADVLDGRRRCGLAATLNFDEFVFQINYVSRFWWFLLPNAGFLAGAEIGLKEHDRLALAKTMMDRKLEGRRTSSKLPELVELVMARPLVSASMVAKTLDVTPQAARRIVGELGLREMTGRGRFRAWGIL
jgi:hypothetical protein